MSQYGLKPAMTIRTAAPAMMRVMFSLMLWTLGVSMELSAVQARERRSTYDFPVERTKAEALQRWVNDGHDIWCRDAQLVAAASLNRILSDDSEIELASLPVERESHSKTTETYTIHSLDGGTTYRVTLRRYRWLLPVAGSYKKMIWVPERVEIITHVKPVSSYEQTDAHLA
jgi:hypothetical protein